MSTPETNEPTKRTATPEAVRMGARIKARRKAAGLIQRDIASALSVSLPSVGHYETGRAAVPPGRLPPLAALLGCKVSELLGEQPEPPVEEPAPLPPAPEEAWLRTLRARLSILPTRYQEPFKSRLLFQGFLLERILREADMRDE